MTDEERRRCIIYAQAAAHLCAAAVTLREFEPDLATRLQVDADVMYAAAQPLLNPAGLDQRFEHEDERRQ